MSIGEKIKLARQEKGYTQLELSKKLGISRSTVACYETERRTPVFKDIQHLSSVLGVSVDYFPDNTPEFNMTDIVLRLNEIFSNNDIPMADKDKVFNDIMKLYVKYK